MNEREKTIVGIAAFVTVMSVFFLIGRLVHFDFDKAREILMPYPIWLQSIIYVALYVLSTSLLWIGPKDIVRVLGAIFYGGPLSTLLVYIAELINAVILFHLSRKLGREMILNSWLKKHEKLSHLGEHTTLLGIISLRINLLFSFRLLDLGYGLTAVPFSKYFTAAVIASPLRLYMVQTILASLGEAIFRSPKAAIVKLMTNQHFFKLSVVYIVIVVGVTLAAVIQKAVLRKRRKAAERLTDR